MFLVEYQNDGNHAINEATFESSLNNTSVFWETANRLWAYTCIPIKQSFESMETLPNFLCP